MVTVRDSAAVVTEIRVLLAPSFEWENYSQRSGITELLVVVSILVLPQFLIVGRGDAKTKTVKHAHPIFVSSKVSSGLRQSTCLLDQFDCVARSHQSRTY
jgi:hypothetical protein